MPSRSYVLENEFTEVVPWHSVYYFNSIETWKIIQAGQNIELASPLEQATVNIQDLDLGIRDCLTSFLHSDRNEWLFKKLSKIIKEVNSQHFKFDLHYIEALQFTMYSEDKNGFYDTHSDTIYGVKTMAGQRKLSFSIQLSNPNSYEGGDLLLHVAKTPIIMSREMGVINFFSSFIPHQVTPVTKGTRYSLVGWINGPSFR